MTSFFYVLKYPTTFKQAEDFFVAVPQYISFLISSTKMRQEV